MKRLKKRLMALTCAACLCGGLTVSAGAAGGFSDVSGTAWYAQAVSDVAARGIMSGTGDGLFSPNALVTRATVVTVLWRMEGASDAAVASPFPDVDPDAWYETAAAWAKGYGIAAGDDKGNFRPDAPVTRQELAVFLSRYAAFKGEQTAEGVLGLYSDASSVSDWAVEGMMHAVGAGLITGTNEGKLNPGGAASRAELAAILDRLDTTAMG